MLFPEIITATLLAGRMPLTAFFASVTRDFHLAEDIFQEVCVKAIGRGESFESAAHLMNWARLAGKNRAIDILRTREGRCVGLSDEMLALLAEEWPDTAQADAMRLALDVCLTRITPNNRELLRLRYFEQRPCAEVAAMMGRKIETVYQALARLHKALGDCIRGRLQSESA
ncbi:RNA polymerase sigma factor [Prosthecobacter vanneervenii]|uniref:RNA polymerase sigma-70 factor (ECF subfamily) n=1 Tax=Prosthecobacter vanneervenii TaxID=48466 RepID=A0A7W7Y8I1_9BACT|nr:sigma-70 family RNA polymerase sigma factor [Prosthecobacter vanneervenii]MBB5031603.1 RNA polymerase sigma-70 factor (ECF subfamily) [Prosthecobacter vanneervenii]